MTKLAVSATTTVVPPSASIAEVSVGSQQELDVSYGSNEDRYMSSTTMHGRKRRSESVNNHDDDNNTNASESKKRRKPGWTLAEDEILLQAVAKERESAHVGDEDDFEDEDWRMIDAIQSLYPVTVPRFLQRLLKKMLWSLSSLPKPV